MYDGIINRYEYTYVSKKLKISNKMCPPCMYSYFKRYNLSFQYWKNFPFSHITFLARSSSQFNCQFLLSIYNRHSTQHKSSSSFSCWIGEENMALSQLHIQFENAAPDRRPHSHTGNVFAKRRTHQIQYFISIAPLVLFLLFRAYIIKTRTQLNKNSAYRYNVSPSHTISRIMKNKQKIIK